MLQTGRESCWVATVSWADGWRRNVAKFHEQSHVEGWQSFMQKPRSQSSSEKLVCRRIELHKRRAPKSGSENVSKHFHKKSIQPWKRVDSPPIRFLSEGNYYKCCRFYFIHKKSSERGEPLKRDGNEMFKNSSRRRFFMRTQLQHEESAQLTKHSQHSFAINLTFWFMSRKVGDQEIEFANLNESSTRRIATTPPSHSAGLLWGRAKANAENSIKH